MMMEADIGVMLLQAKECHRLWKTQKSGEAWSRYVPRAPEGGWPCSHLDFKCLASRTMRQYYYYFCCFKLFSSLCCFVTEVSENNTVSKPAVLGAATFDPKSGWDPF